MKKSWATDNSYYVTNERGYNLDFYETYVPAEGDKTKDKIKDDSKTRREVFMIKTHHSQIPIQCKIHWNLIT